MTPYQRVIKLVLTSFEDIFEDASVIAGLLRSDGILRYSIGVNPKVSVIIEEARVAVTFPVPSTKMTYNQAMKEIN